MLRDGKVNVVGIVRQLALAPADQKYFHTKPEIRDLVNEFAEAQGLRGIGSRSALDQVDLEVRVRFNELSERKRGAETALTEALRQIEYLTLENEQLRAERDRCRLAINEIYGGRDLPAELVRSINER
jgi:cell division protein FtsB